MSKTSFVSKRLDDTRAQAKPRSTMKNRSKTLTDLFVTPPVTRSTKKLIESLPLSRNGPSKTLDMEPVGRRHTIDNGDELMECAATVELEYGDASKYPNRKPRAMSVDIEMSDTSNSKTINLPPAPPLNKPALSTAMSPVSKISASFATFSGTTFLHKVMINEPEYALKVHLNSLGVGFLLGVWIMWLKEAILECCIVWLDFLIHALRLGLIVGGLFFAVRYVLPMTLGVKQVEDLSGALELVSDSASLAESHGTDLSPSYNLQTSLPKLNSIVSPKRKAPYKSTSPRTSILLARPLRSIPRHRLEIPAPPAATSSPKLKINMDNPLIQQLLHEQERSRRKGLYHSEVDLTDNHKLKKIDFSAKPVLEDDSFSILDSSIAYNNFVHGHTAHA
ncbi:hypothetical protein BABINDRAFT_9546 [Babjeviella inositovora NRRL Y-12698]|uniref:Uncharacterized protein n=1 Tax=Babjeviella inositovora NRRL Y-12698 TaxID=984486 RepID=A0A1E3QKX9_9ASCO|nr:uncharacterized protein BABINDRAFT_9546 [Babjeviella inositovora NRRL Y-12698]ODQ78343.1 hypothetical protein BABINDRAFT_9546 [Babjeviella inositovora NRRL Y-12698]